MMTLAKLNALALVQGVSPGLVDDARRHATPHAVDTTDLTVDKLDPNEFRRRFQERRAWCKEQCRGPYEIEPIRENGRDKGRRFRFGEPNDALFFKLWFG
jgi:hypothetical protein